MVKIAVDVMGMDNGSKVAVDAILQFLSKHDDVSVVAFGKEEELEALKDKCEIVNCTDVMEMEDGALANLRKKESSMIKAVSYAKDNIGCSSCSTGYYLFNNQCYKKPLGCSFAKENEGCISCVSGYTLIQNTCIKHPNKCAIIKEKIGCIT